jgi:general secretion pathway protein E
VRILCPHCKEAYPAEDFELNELGLAPERLFVREQRRAIPNTRYFPRLIKEAELLDAIVPGVRPTFYKAKGCDKCTGTGFQGRRGIYELLLMDDAIGPLILRNADAQAIKRAAMEQGMDSLRDDGARKVITGLTTVEEVLAATQEDVEAPDSVAVPAALAVN